MDAAPGCLPGLRPDRVRAERFFAGCLDHGGSEDGGLDEFDESVPARRSNSPIRSVNSAITRSSVAICPRSAAFSVRSAAFSVRSAALSAAS